MVGYAKYENLYKIYDPSSQKTFIEISVNFEEEPMEDIKLVKWECSHPPVNDDVSYDSFYEFFCYYMEDEYDEIHAYHDSPIRPKWADKTIQAVGDLDGYLLNSRNTISQFHNAFSTCDSNIPKRCFMMVRYNP